MNFAAIPIPVELGYILASICSLLILCSSSFALWGKLKPSPMLRELTLRTRSWWFIFIGVCLLVLAPPLVGTILIGYVSFLALREMFSICGMRTSDQHIRYITYLAVPIQYFLGYQMYYSQFLAFIPIVMFILVPTLLVLQGNTQKIGRAMALVPSLLIMTSFMLSHIVLLYGIKIEGFDLGPGSLIMYLLAITAFNDVFQFTWGKLLGKRKILPKISPNKTWEGFLGGILSSSLFSCTIRFLTPLSMSQALVMGLILGIGGFMGDIIISAIKRDLQIKDTGNSIPGHGGIMDRLDSILITAPVFFHLLTFYLA